MIDDPGQDDNEIASSVSRLKRFVSIFLLIYSCTYGVGGVFIDAS